MTRNVGFLFHVHCDIKFLLHLYFKRLKKKIRVINNIWGTADVTKVLTMTHKCLKRNKHCNNYSGKGSLTD